MEKKVDLSVIIPTFRREEQVVKAIESVLGITKLHLEILVGDDSPDGSAQPYIDAITDERVVYKKHTSPTGGRPAIVRNDLATNAKGEVFYFLDDDDTIEPDTLVHMHQKLMASTVGVAIGAVNPFGDSDSPVVAFEKKHYSFARRKFSTYLTKYQCLSRLMNAMPLMVCSAGIVKREAFYKVNGFNTEMPLYEDIEFYVRTIREFGYIFINKILLNRKTGGESLIQNEKDDVRTCQSYRMMSDAYRKKYGFGEWALLKLLNRSGLV